MHVFQIDLEEVFSQNSTRFFGVERLSSLQLPHHAPQSILPPTFLLVPKFEDGVDLYQYPRRSYQIHHNFFQKNIETTKFPTLFAVIQRADSSLKRNFEFKCVSLR